MRALREFLLSGERIIFDGAMGTMLQRRGLPAGVSPEEFCLAQPAVLEGIHADYLRAGANVLTTNTFGGTRYKLPAHLDVVDFNTRMASAARKAADAHGGAYVAGSIGPTGHFMAPLGPVSFEEMVEAFQEQIRGLCKGGIDLVLAETQFDIAEARAIVIAARRECDLPVIVSMTYEDGRTLTGSSVEVCVATLANMGVDAIGMNCSAGPVEMAPLVQELLAFSPVPVIVQPNAGLPVLEQGETIFPLQPAEFANLTGAFAREGVQIIGGCCGTTPDHIAALRQVVAELPPVQERPQRQGIALTSRFEVVRLGAGFPVALIGERINPTGKKVLTSQFQAGQMGEAMRFAEEQLQLGAHILDVNTGAPLVDETLLLPKLVARLQKEHNAPLALDSPNPQALAEALKMYPASPLVNSISGEEGRMDILGPLCRDYGAPFILLPLQGGDLPEKASERIAIIEKLLTRMDDLHIPRHLALVDILALSASSTPTAALECLEVIRYCTETLGLPTTCGLSNISFGLPARELLNATFLTAAAGAGLSSCIANPSSVRLREALGALHLLMAHDEGAERFIGGYSQWTNGAANGSLGGAGGAGNRSGNGSGNGVGGGGGTASGILQQGASTTQGQLTIEQAVISGKMDDILPLVEVALAAGEAPYAIVGERLIPAITEVGNKYERKEYFLPQLIRSAETMQTAFGLLRPLLEEMQGAEEKIKIILATVEGDIHDIGKNIVGLMLGNHGFDVIDLGKDMKAEAIVAAAQEHNAPLIGLSALMTTTMVRMEDTVTLIKEKNLNCKVLVGGAVVTEAFATSIGAHYSEDAVGAVRLAQKLLSL